MFNPHKSAVNIIKDCRSYTHARKVLRKFWLTKSEQSAILKLAKESGMNFK